ASLLISLHLCSDPLVDPILRTPPSRLTHSRASRTPAQVETNGMPRRIEHQPLLPEWLDNAQTQSPDSRLQLRAQRPRYADVVLSGTERQRREPVNDIHVLVDTHAEGQRGATPRIRDGNEAAIVKAMVAAHTLGKRERCLM